MVLINYLSVQSSQVNGSCLYMFFQFIQVLQKEMDAVENEKKNLFATSLKWDFTSYFYCLIELPLSKFLFSVLVIVSYLLLRRTTTT